MTDTTRAPREKLSITRPIGGTAGIVPHPRIEQGIERARDREAVRSDTPVARDEARDQPSTPRAGAGAGNVQDVAIAALLNPVCDNLDLGDDGVASLAAFTRRLLEGGRPRRSASV